MTIRIVTDSTCDLPHEVVQQYRITVIPLYINIGPQGYLDGVEMSRVEFYSRLPEFNPHPTTGTPGQEAFRSAYDQLAAEGATEILSIHISHSLSATVDVARLAAAETTSARVTVLDSSQLSLGTGFLVETAAHMAEAGSSMEAILPVLQAQMARSHVFAALDTLEFLRRSGRMNHIMFGIGSLLNLKPLLKMHAGKPTSERVRTRERANQRLLALLREKLPLERVAIVHTHSPDRVAEIKRLVQHLLPAGEVSDVDITPVIGAHIGPGAVGFACVTAE